MSSNETLDLGILTVNCWPFWPLWECVGANIAGLCSTALWFIVLLPQILKNFYRRSVSGLSFLWGVANFTASLVNLFFVFSIKLPFYSKISAVYMPVLEFIILGQFMIYFQRPFTTRLLVLLVCLLGWGAVVELELNLPESKDKIQWIAIALWSIETFPQVILNMKLQSTEGQSTVSVIITIVGKTTDFLVTYGLNMPLPFVVMCYFSSTTAFINGFQVVWYGKDSWFSNKPPPLSEVSTADENVKLLKDSVSNSLKDLEMNTDYKTLRPSSFRYYCVNIVRYISLTYIVLGLITFAIGLFLRTMSFFALLGPISCFCIVFCANEYYRLRRSKRCLE